MKRKLLLTTLLLTLALCSILGLTACGGNNDNGNNSGGGNSTIAVTSITLNRSSLNLEIGDTVSLYETIYPSNATDKSITWSSSNTSVATVSNGTVTAKSAGSTTITVRTNNNKTATCSITVNNPVVAVSSVSLNKTSATLEVGDTLSLSATISPSNATDKSITWSSSNTSVATVSNGTVTAKSSGTATITVKTSNNKTATCYVTVINEEILPTAIYLSKSSVELNEGESITLTTTLLPSNVTNKVVEWIVLDTSIATVNNGIITAKSEGETMLVVTTANDLSVSCTIIVSSPFVFETYGSGYALMEYRGSEDVVVVPSTYKGKAVTAIGKPEIIPSGGYNVIYKENGFAHCQSIKEIILPESITLISYGAFYNCYNLEYVNIPNAVEGFGYKAFYGCNSLKKLSLSFDKYDELQSYFMASSIDKLTIPSTLKILEITGKSVYWWNLENIALDKLIITKDVSQVGTLLPTAYIEVAESNTLYKSIDGNLYTKDGKTLIYYAKQKKEKSFTLPNSVTSIGESAFSGCSSLTSVVIPNSVISIGRDAFYNCSSLKSVTIGDSVESIGDYAFGWCSSLTNITVPNSVTSIGQGAFRGCSSLTSITIPFAGKSRTASNGYDQTFGYIFGWTLESTSDKINGAIYQYYGGGTLSGQDRYFHYYIPESLISVTITGDIAGWAFYNCSSLKSVTMGDSVTSIGDAAFAYCSSLKSVTMGDSVTSIGDAAFAYCSSLESVYFVGSVEEWSEISIQDYTSSFENATKYYYVENESDLPNDNGNYWHYVDGKPIIWT